MAALDGTSAISTIGDADLGGSLARTDAGLQQTRLLRNYATRSLPDLTHNYAAKGTFYGGSAGVAADRLKEDVGNQYGDVQRALDLKLAELRRQGILAATGVGI